jgi:hypothetical protein
MKGFDIWQNDREKATIDRSGMKYLIKGNQLMMWRPKAQNPNLNVIINDSQIMKNVIDINIQKFVQWQEYRLKNKIDRNGTPEDLEKIKVGDIYHYSWGYEQTQCEYYQVIEKNGKTVKIREIGSQTVPGSEGFMSDSRIPVKDSFLDKAPILTKRIQFSNGEAYLSMDYGSCNPWNGKAHYCSWYA